MLVASEVQQLDVRPRLTKARGLKVHPNNREAYFSTNRATTIVKKSHDLL